MISKLKLNKKKEKQCDNFIKKRKNQDILQVQPMKWRQREPLKAQMAGLRVEDKK